MKQFILLPFILLATVSKKQDTVPVTVDFSYNANQHQIVTFKADNGPLVKFDSNQGAIQTKDVPSGSATICYELKFNGSTNAFYALMEDVTTIVTVAPYYGETKNCNSYNLTSATIFHTEVIHYQ